MEQLTVNVVVAVHSRAGHALDLAQAIAEGAQQQQGAVVRLRRVPEIEPEEELRAHPRFGAAFSERVAPLPIATLADLTWADAIILGCGTRFGGPSAELAHFLEQTGGLWLQGALVGKVGAAFATASTPHGGLEMTVQSILVHLMHLGLIVVTPGYADPIMHEAGSPYGAVARAGGLARRAVSDPDRAAARFLGSRVAEVARRVRPVAEPTAPAAGLP